MSDNSEVPRWLHSLLTEKFFNACVIHEEERKNEKNVFCFDCCEGICPGCIPHHRSHRLLQIRRYMYHDVIKLKEAEKMMDCAHLQHYKSNGAKVVFLNQRPPTRPSNALGSFCIHCDKNLQKSFHFCSLSCKLQHLLDNGRELSMYLRNCDFTEPGLDKGQLTQTPESELELSGSVATESSSSAEPAGLGECLELLNSATIAIIKKKRSNHPPRVRSEHGIRPVPEAVVNRRKGTPHRSPFN